ncbi:hypothetical protein J6590_102881, partial [Homalodisca vitripennis]
EIFTASLALHRGDSTSLVHCRAHGSQQTGADAWLSVESRLFLIYGFCEGRIEACPEETEGQRPRPETVGETAATGPEVVALLQGQVHDPDPQLRPSSSFISGQLHHLIQHPAELFFSSKLSPPSQPPDA